MPNISSCRACLSNDLMVAWDLAKSPYGDLFQPAKDSALKVQSHSMTLVLCQHCSLLQITEETNLEMQYDNYLYTSGTTHGLGRFYTQVVDRLISDFSLDKTDLVLDIGSNDGSFLINFKNRGFEVLGIEPAKPSCEVARSQGINTMNSYFDSHIVEGILALPNRPKLISINYTLANVPNVLDFVSLISELMNEETILSIITGYHPDQFAVNMFDYVGHDHLSYFTVESIQILCHTLGLKILDVSRVEHKGGSIQFLVSKRSSARIVQPSVTQMLQREKWMGIRSEAFYRDLRKRIEEAVSLVSEILDVETFQNLNGVGASISTTYLCNQFGISSRISGLYDDDKNKIGKFAPASGIEVHPLSTLPSGDDSLTIILAWQHTEKFISRLKEIHFAGRILIPLPVPTLIEL